MKKTFLIFISFVLLLQYGFTAHAVIEKKKRTVPKLDPKAFQLSQVAYHLASQKDYDTAIVYFKRSLEIEPKYKDALFNLGSIYRIQKKYTDAYVCFQQLVTINPNDQDAQMEKVITLIGLKNFTEASYEFRKISPTTARYREVQKILEKAVLNQKKNIAETQAPKLQETTQLYPSRSKPSGQLSWESLNFSSPTGITVDSDQNVYVANFTTDTVEKISPDGSRRTTIADAKLVSGPSDLFFDPKTGRLLVCNYKSGTIISLFEDGHSQILAKNLSKPYSFHLTDDGRLLVSEQGKKALSVVKIH
jgi:tetratricopeptide (TPR) repeat protein